MDLKKTLFILPNLLTASSLVFGMLAILRCLGPDIETSGGSTVNENIYRSSLLLFYSFIFDLFDGRVARMTRTQSAFGVDFDSLADLVSFGVAPAVIAYRWALRDAGPIGMAVCAMYVLAGAVRLARFNVMSRLEAPVKKAPGKYMLGLPIPMAAAFVVALVVAAKAMGGWPWLTVHGLNIQGIGYPMLLVIMAALAVLMVSTVKFRSFKDLKINAFTITVLVIALGSCAFLWLKFSAAYILIWLLCLYVALGFGEAIIFWPRRRRERLHNSGK